MSAISGDEIHYSLIPNNQGITCEVVKEKYANIITVNNDGTTISANVAVGEQTSSYVKNIFVSFIPIK